MFLLNQHMGKDSNKKHFFADDDNDDERTMLLQ